jgi:hypothetical protein
MSDFKQLFDRYIDGHLTREELARLFEGMSDDPSMPGMLDELLRSHSLQGLAHPDREDVLFQRIMAKDRRQTTIRRISIWSAAAAAAILLICISLVYNRPAQQTKIASKEIIAMPGKKGAVLTLSNGQTLSLDSLGNGSIAQQNGKTILLNNGILSYKDGHNAEAVYNTLSTARGREFQLTLPDGTQVWLNAASSIRYPTAFSGAQRQVEVTGEVYFEIAKNEHQPFIVSIGGGQPSVEVLGTRFNVNAYPDENSFRTTLAEGAVRIIGGYHSVQLHPGQQARVSGRQVAVTAVNVAQVMAWKEGLFSFKDVPFDEVMRQLSRWYDIDVVYENGVPDIDFEGELGRDVSLSKILFFLERVGVHYRVENGKTIVISK